MYISHWNVVKPPASLRDWFNERLVQEHQLSTDFKTTRNKYSPRFWRLDEHLRLQTFLPKFPALLTPDVMEELWNAADKNKVEALRAKWDAPCTDPYYDRRYGVGSD